MLVTIGFSQTLVLFYYRYADLFTIFQCNAPCGGGLRRRNVLCLKNDVPVNIEHCDIETMPVDNEECNQEPCERGTAMLDTYSNFIMQNKIKLKLIIFQNYCRRICSG